MLKKIFSMIRNFSHKYTCDFLKLMIYWAYRTPLVAEKMIVLETITKSLILAAKIFCRNHCVQMNLAFIKHFVVFVFIDVFLKAFLKGILHILKHSQALISFGDIALSDFARSTNNSSVDSPCISDENKLHHSWSKWGSH